ncbi:MAG TPA: 1,2-phenylacetyl-CoA epoxidase subunit PaaD [Steroidobacteraceae bacterium]|jgi:ring-1,2-phenylacetyl-CoA epoxidase subunit PaaD|nr:1,2-phenylacetyl-CoA epoxidase subunit PaaD [Steroidobacteraceae bacterium]
MRSGQESVAARAAEARTAEARVAAAWRLLESVEDPEIPALSIVDLGLIRFAQVRPDGILEVGLSPTYVGCPATEVIRRSVQDALRRAHVGGFKVMSVLSPAWSSDWITAEGRRKLFEYGIVPPERNVSNMREVLRGSRPVACPRCRSIDTETVSEFGSTPCKALHRCRTCLEPFEYFKCI